MLAIEFKNVSKSFNQHQIIRDLSLKIEAGEFVVLVGPSGCGKSTLLRLLAGLESLDSGEILLGGQSIVHLPPHQRKLAMVFQNYSLYPHMTVFENLAFSMKLQGVKKAVIEEKVKKVSELLQLEKLLNRKPKALSGGQRQRVAVGRALVREMPVVLFDEPLSNLDAHLRGQMRAELKHLHEKLGNTILYVTHDQTEAMTLGARIVVLRQGVIEQVGTPQELYSEPQKQFVAEFIGSPSMNFINLSKKHFLPGLPELSLKNLTQKSNSLLVNYSGKLTGEVTAKLKAEVTVGVRPENLRAGAKAGMQKIGEAKLSFIENLGSHCLYHLVSGEVELTSYETPKPYLSEGKKVEVFADPKKLLFFDSTTGERII